MRIKGLLASVICAALIAAPAMAHRLGVPVTSIEWNSRSSVWEITHRMSAHDFEAAQAPGFDLGSLSDADLQQKVSTYIQSNFQILGLMGLNYIGAETAGDHVWAYYELSGFDQPVLIRNQLLLDTDATSSSLVNIQTGGELRSLNFNAESDWSSVTLARPKLEQR